MSTSSFTPFEPPTSIVTMPTSALGPKLIQLKRTMRGSRAAACSQAGTLASNEVGAPEDEGCSCADDSCVGTSATSTTAALVVLAHMTIV